MAVISKHVLFAGFLLLVLASACNENQSSVASEGYSIPLDSLGIGKTVQFHELPGRFIAFNPDSANKVVILGEKGKHLNTIYKGTGLPDQPISINNLAVDEATMEIYIFSPLQHSIFVYNANGGYKKKIPIPEAGYGQFFRMNNRFVFTDKKDNTKLYLFDSTGQQAGW